jgi:hypothetical protein
MDTELLVEPRLDEGKRLLAEMVREGFAVAIAFWARVADSDLWRLYVGWNSNQPEEVVRFYRVVIQCLERIGPTDIMLLDVKLIPEAGPLALVAIEMRGRFLGRGMARYRGKKLANLGFEEALIYPPLDHPSGANYLDVAAVTDVRYENGQLEVWKTNLSIPTFGDAPEPDEWVADVRLEHGHLVVRKVKVTRQPHGLAATYTEQIDPICHEIQEAEQTQ